MWMPSAASLVLVVKLVAFVAIAYYLSLRKTPTLRGIIAFLIVMTGALGFYEGFTLAVREDTRARYGRVVPGVVVEMYQSDGHGRTNASGGREGPRAGTSGFLISGGLARTFALGSGRIRFVDYRYPCDAGRGTCFGCDYVGPGLWSRLEVGKAVNVRQADGESVTARLDENPQWGVAIAEMGFASLFLGIAALISGRWKPRARTKYMTAPAVVMAVDPVKYRDTTRWKVRFAYFDGNGDAQESADEVTQPTWKAGDDCVAVYRPDEPDLATLQPPHHA